jgi:hypothetical protein
MYNLTSLDHKREASLLEGLRIFGAQAPRPSLATYPFIDQVAVLAACIDAGCGTRREISFMLRSLGSQWSISDIDHVLDEYSNADPFKGLWSENEYGTYELNFDLSRYCDRDTRDRPREGACKHD